MGFGGQNLTHLQFVDGTLIYYQVKSEEVNIVKRLLKVFENGSGLKINYHKTVLCCIVVDNDALNNFAQLINARLSHCLLSMPIFY